jgi:hypothetical protein
MSKNTTAKQMKKSLKELIARSMKYNELIIFLKIGKNIYLTLNIL